MYKSAVRWMVRRNIERLNQGNYQPTLRMFASDATLAFPGDNTWSNMIRPTQLGPDAFATHRGRDELEQFLRRYVDEKLHMVVDDILVNGPPWNTRAAVRVHHSMTADDGAVLYANRAVLFVTARWGKLVEQEDYEDTERVAAYDRLLSSTSGRSRHS